MNSLPNSTVEKILKKINDAECSLIGSENIGGQALLLIKCNCCHNITERKSNNFRRTATKFNKKCCGKKIFQDNTLKRINEVLGKCGCVLTKQIGGKSRMIEFKCKCGVVKTISANNVIGKTVNFVGCGCSKEVNNDMYNRLDITLKSKGGELLSYDKNSRSVIYRCSCGNEGKSSDSNILRKGWKGCGRCATERSKRDFKDIQEEFKLKGIYLPTQKYVNNKTKLEYNCFTCGQFAHMSYSELKRGRRCEHCCKFRAKITNLEKYGVENIFQSPVIKDRIKETCMRKYGVSHHMKSRDILDKAIKTNLEKYGIKFSFHSLDSKLKSRETCRKLYGEEYPLRVKEIRDKALKLSKEACMKKYGVEYVLQCKDVLDEVLKKSKETCMKKYGVEYAMQHPMFMSKAIKTAFSSKKYTFPNGRVEMCQGYESYCLDYLLKDYEEEDIIVGSEKMPMIWYINQKGKKARYHPDIFIISENTIIEVKSWWTFEKDFIKNIRKFRNVASIGFKMVLCIIEKCKKGGKIECKDGCEGYHVEKRIYDEDGNYTDDDGEEFLTLISDDNFELYEDTEEENEEGIEVDIEESIFGIIFDEMEIKE